MKTSVMPKVPMTNIDFDHAHVIWVAAHSQEVRDHEHRIGHNQPSAKLPRPITVMQALHHENDPRIKESEVDQKAQQPHRKSIRWCRHKGHAERQPGRAFDRDDDQPPDPEGRTTDATSRGGKEPCDIHDNRSAFCRPLFGACADLLQIRRDAKLAERRIGGGPFDEVVWTIARRKPVEFQGLLLPALQHGKFRTVQIGITDLPTAPGCILVIGGGKCRRERDFAEEEANQRSRPHRHVELLRRQRQVCSGDQRDARRCRTKARNRHLSAPARPLA